MHLENVDYLTRFCGGVMADSSGGGLRCDLDQGQRQK
jgi:hypothetical protein